MHSLHPQARTTPAVRQEIARSTEPTGVLAQRFSVSTETVRKWRKRGAAGLPGPLQPAAQAALESHGGGAGDRLRPAPLDRLSAR